MKDKWTRRNCLAALGQLAAFLLGSKAASAAAVAPQTTPAPAPGTTISIVPDPDSTRPDTDFLVLRQGRSPVSPPTATARRRPASTNFLVPRRKTSRQPEFDEHDRPQQRDDDDDVRQGRQPELDRGRQGGDHVVCL